MRTAFSVAKRIGVVLLAWIGASVTFSFIPVLLDVASSAERVQKESAGYVLVGMWAFYRVLAALFRMPAPRGKMRIAVDLGWGLFTYLFGAGTIVAATGHPTPAASVVGGPIAILTYVLLVRERNRSAVTTPAPDRQTE